MQSKDLHAVDDFLAAVQGAAIRSCTCWASDAVVDATVPGWRFRLNGPDEIRAEYSGWFADPGEFTELTRVPLPDGELVRYLLAWSEDGVAHLAHHVHILEVNEGLIRSDTVICGGRWPEPLIAEMQAAQASHDAVRVEADHVHS